jgi:hypothetical protein
MRSHSSISSGACDKQTKDIHATWQPTPTLRLDCLPLNRGGLRRNVNADSHDILKGSIESQTTRIKPRHLLKMKSADQDSRESTAPLPLKYSHYLRQLFLQSQATHSSFIIILFSVITAEHN